MTSVLRRIDGGIARGEAAIAAFVLLAMVVLAAVQALLRNLTNLEISFANQALGELTWIDSVLQKGTLWLAFLGASLATHDDKHIAIDVLHRVVSSRVRLALKGAIGLAAGAVAIGLAMVFFAAVMNIAQDRPLEFEVLADAGPVHICDAPPGAAADAGLGRPAVFCAVRGVLAALGAPVETPWSALELIAPVMFLLMAVRLVGKGLASFAGLMRGDAEGTR